MDINNLPRPEHPEPMMFRPDWINLNGEWQFEFDHGVTGRERGLFKPDAEFSRRITVPFCPESELSGIGYKDFMSSVWYRRSFELSAGQLSGRVLLHFGAVDYECDIYINGNHAGYHFGGYSSFTVDITGFAAPGSNVLTVNARDNCRSCRQPLGKQCSGYYPSGCFYTRTTGIWQTVWLEFVPESYIKTLKYYPDIAAGEFNIEVTLSAPGKVTAEAFYGEKPVGKVEKTTVSNSVRLTLSLSEKHLWEPGHGRLYDLKFTLESGGCTDIISSYAGLREITISGFKVLINGKSVFQRTVLDQGFYPDGIYTAPDDAALKRDIELSMALGFNGARLHEKIFEPRFLYHCDKAGYLVWEEHANWGLDINNTSGFFAFLPEWCEAVERDFNHPSIIGWCPFNETWVGRDGRILKAVYDETKRLDPTRPVIDTSGGYHIMTDIYDQHDYEQNPERFISKYAEYDGCEESFELFDKDKQTYIPGLPFFLSEFGGIKWVTPEDAAKLPKNSWGYGSAPQSEEEFFARYEGLVAGLLKMPNLMGFCYTQLYDVEQEVNGLYKYSREPKFSDYSRIKNANTAKAAIED